MNLILLLIIGADKELDSITLLGEPEIKNVKFSYHFREVRCVATPPQKAESKHGIGFRTQHSHISNILS